MRWPRFDPLVIKRPIDVVVTDLRDFDFVLGDLESEGVRMTVLAYQAFADAGIATEDDDMIIFIVQDAKREDVVAVAFVYEIEFIASKSGEVEIEAEHLVAEVDGNSAIKVSFEDLLGGLVMPNRAGGASPAVKIKLRQPPIKLLAVPR